MDTKQIWNALVFNPTTNFAFEGVFAKDTLKDIKKKPKLLICNTDPAHKPGEHWVLFFFDGNSVDFYDSLGRDIYHYGKEFVKFVKKFVPNYEYCTKRTQPLYSNECGEYCLFYAYHRCLGLNMSDIVNKMESYEYVVNFVKRNFCICKKGKCNLLQACRKM